jgi:alpha-mannosidase
MKNEASNPVIKLCVPIKSAWQTTHIETNEKELIPINGKLKMEFLPTQIKTYRVILN